MISIPMKVYRKRKELTNVKLARDIQTVNMKHEFMNVRGQQRIRKLLGAHSGSVEGARVDVAEVGFKGHIHDVRKNMLQCHCIRQRADLGQK